MRKVTKVISILSGREEGQTLTEYGLLLFFIAVVTILAVTLLGENISTFFSTIATSLNS